MNDYLNELSGIEFENICQRILNSLGFVAETTKTTGDGGIDIVAYSNQSFFSGKYIIQCKRYSGSVGEPVIRDLYGVVTSERANKGILMTTGYFTSSAIKFAEDKNIELIDGKQLNLLITQNNINLDSFFESPEYILRENLQRTGLSLDEYQFYCGNEEEASNLIICKKELSKRNDIKVRAKIIGILYSRLDSILFNDSGYDFSILAIHGGNCIEKYASSIISSEPKKSNEKRIRYNTMLIMCVCDLVRGNISDAILRYDELLNDNDLESHIDVLKSQYKLDVVKTICSLLRIIGATNKIDQYKGIYTEFINQQIESNLGIINGPCNLYPEVIPKLIRENEILSSSDCYNENIFVNSVLGIGSGINRLEDDVNYNTNHIDIDECGNLKIWGEFLTSGIDQTQLIIAGTTFIMDKTKLEQEKKRIEVLL